MATLRVRGEPASGTTECALCAHQNPHDARFCCSCGAALGAAALGETLAAGAARRALRVASPSQPPQAALPPPRWIGVPPPEQSPGSPSMPAGWPGQPRTLAEMLDAATSAKHAATARAKPPEPPAPGATTDAAPTDADASRSHAAAQRPSSDVGARSPGPQEPPPPLFAGDPPAAWTPARRARRPLQALVVVAVLLAVLAVPALLAWRDLGVSATAVPMAAAPTPVPTRVAGGAVVAPAAQTPPVQAPVPVQVPPAAAECPPQVDALGLCAAMRPAR